MRLSLWLAFLFVIVSSLSLSATYFVARETQEDAIEESLVQVMAGYRATPSVAALAAVVRAETRETDPTRRLLSYRLPSGVIAGNAAIVQDAEGFSAVISGVSPGEVKGDYISLTRLINGGLMTVALTAQPLENLRKTYLLVFLFSLLPTCIAALSGGFFLARRDSKHLVTIESTLALLTSGELGARVDTGNSRQNDLSRIGAQVNRMADAQEKSMSALQQISADIAHDLKSPIQRVSVLLSDLSKTDDLPQEAVDLAERASDETQGIVRVFQSLLQIAQVEGGSPRAGFALVDLGELAATFVDIYQPAAEEQGRQLVLHIPDTPANISGDKTLLGQLLANLIENALRHTPVGTNITVCVAKDADKIHMSVADNGAGIPVDQHQNVLRRLYRLEASRTTPGSGLGLSLVAAIADLHEAELVLLSANPGLKVDLTFAAI
ncbi:MAG: HAMP domain-containing histidine kinase [Rhodobacteraceae bacterium]|nr:HAMP domain-containing histidine kinase [Paracoccaceae bacterium]